MHDSPAAATVADRLRGARRRGFVGRVAELELFRSALEAAEPPFSVLWICGPGGVGKTTLLGALAGAARAAGREPALVDLRSADPSPPGFAAELGRAARPARPVLLLDTFETAGAREDWLREEFLPALPAGALVVVASRARPGDAWRADPGWRALLRVVSLRNLDRRDARALLRVAGVAGDLHEPILDLTHGHPLALALLLDVLAQQPDAAPHELGDVPDVVGRLVASFVAGAPSPRHRLAVELSAHARTTTAGALRAALGEEHGDALFEWLRGLSFMECGAHGLFPHDLAREVIDADLRWRDPAGYVQVHEHVRADVVERLLGTEGREQQRALADLMFLHRNNPVVLPFWDWESLGEVYADAVRPADHAAIAAMVERHEGPESAAIAARWLAHRPEWFAVFRGRGPEPIGFLVQLALHAATDEELAGDPGARAMWEHAQRHGRPRPGEEVLAGRFFMDREAYQAPSRSFNVVTMLSTREWLVRTRLSWYYIAFAAPDAVAPMMAHIDFERAPDADFEVGGRRYGVYARDWRREPGAQWLDAMAPARARRRAARRRRAGRRRSRSRSPSSPPPCGARCATLHRPGALAGNPLLRSRVLRGSEGAAPDALRALVEEAVEALRGDPRDAKLVRALERTYLRARADAGGRGRAARAAVQHVPRASHARRGARRRPALAARAVRQLSSNSAGSRLATRQPDRRTLARDPTTRRWRDATDRRARGGDRRQHRRAAGGPRADGRLRTRHGARPRRAAGRVRGPQGGAAGPPRARAAAARPGLPRRSCCPAQRRARRRRGAHVRGARRDALRDRRAPARARVAPARTRCSRAARSSRATCRRRVRALPASSWSTAATRSA